MVYYFTQGFTACIICGYGRSLLTIYLKETLKLKQVIVFMLYVCFVATKPYRFNILLKKKRCFEVFLKLV